ncbi:O-antigen ligase family protein [Bacillus sp. BRMEA1]|uniref:O-antigen ligase family protein n=1 Tax=Neobacillus endophyticus TaxID=2738405 RepID=UPI001563F5D9|nr:O-antigen ligase family protein [Neobacillus endophyticus]NRD76693.1 O-antigen ligase family protein [Neobacillus endophyticus]
MKLSQNNIWLLIIGILAVIAGTFIGHSKVAMLISLLIAIGAFWKKETGILFLLVFIPIRPFLITMNPGYKILGDAIIGFLFVRTIFDYRKDLKKLFNFHPFEWAFFAFGVIGIISALLTGVSLKAIIFQLRAYYLFYLVFYIVKRMEISADFVRKMAGTTFVMGLVLSIQGIVEKISNKTMLMPQEWQQWYLSPTNFIRVYGLLKGPNELSLYLLITFFVSLYVLKHAKGFVRYLVYIGLVLFGTTILLTYSRGTILTLIVFILVYVIFIRKWRPLLPILAVAVLSLGLFVGVNAAATSYASYLKGHHEVGNNQEGANRFRNVISDQTLEQSSSSGRIYRVKKAAEIFKDHPVIGTGFATFGGAATISYHSPIYKHYGIKTDFYSDNQYILVLVETGIIGMLMMLMVIYFLLTTTWKNRKSFYSPLLIYFLTALLVGGTVYNILENDSFMMLYFILLGIALRRGRKENEPDLF